MFDHFGGAQAAAGVEQPGFAALLDLVAGGHAYVKVSAAYRSSQKAPAYGDVAPLARALIAANPERILWGTDWPHPHAAIPAASSTGHAVLRHRRRAGAEPAAILGPQRRDPPQDPGRQSGAAVRLLGPHRPGAAGRFCRPHVLGFVACAARAGARRLRSGQGGGRSRAPSRTTSTSRLSPAGHTSASRARRRCRSPIANGAPSASRWWCRTPDLPFDNERAEGLWQRVGEYWWLGLPMGSLADQNFTGIHDQNGAVFPVGRTAITPGRPPLSIT